GIRDYKVTGVQTCALPIFRAELASTNKYRVVLTRSGDANPTFDERAAAANAARPIAFLSFHAGNLGKRIPRLVVYTYGSPSSRRSEERRVGKECIWRWWQG